MAAPHFSSGLDDAKRAMRRAMRGRTGDDAALRAHLAAVLGDTAPVAAVWPLPGEPDLRPLLLVLDRVGVAIALPVVTGPGEPLLFRAWRGGEPLRPGPLGTTEPAGGEPVDPAVILVPLVAFDRARRRLGRGGGFYDRTLAARPGARAIGFAHASREVPAVPTGPHDRPLDLVVTDREVIG